LVFFRHNNRNMASHQLNPIFILVLDVIIKRLDDAWLGLLEDNK